MKQIVVSVCLGSSCYPRGNRMILQQLKEYISKNQLQNRILLQGNLCHGLCTEGPIVTINDKVYTKVDEISIIELIQMQLRDET